MDRKTNEIFHNAGLLSRAGAVYLVMLVYCEPWKAASVKGYWPEMKT